MIHVSDLVQQRERKKRPKKQNSRLVSPSSSARPWFLENALKFRLKILSIFMRKRFPNAEKRERKKCWKETLLLCLLHHFDFCFFKKKRRFLCFFAFWCFRFISFSIFFNSGNLPIKKTSLWMTRKVFFKALEPFFRSTCLTILS